MQEKMYCQYCGENERLEINQYNGEYAVRCQHCGSIGPMGKDPEFAILKWNSRVQEAPEMPQERPMIMDDWDANQQFCPFCKDKCKGSECMMWVFVVNNDGRCGLVNTMYINSTGCGAKNE